MRSVSWFFVGLVHVSLVVSKQVTYLMPMSATTCIFACVIMCWCLCVRVRVCVCVRACECWCMRHVTCVLTSKCDDLYVLRIKKIETRGFASVHTDMNLPQNWRKDSKIYMYVYLYINICAYINTCMSIYAYTFMNVQTHFPYLETQVLGCSASSVAHGCGEWFCVLGEKCHCFGALHHWETHEIAVCVYSMRQRRRERKLCVQCSDGYQGSEYVHTMYIYTSKWFR